MADITSSCTYIERGQELNWKKIVIVTPNTADSGDTITLNLSNYSSKYLAGIIGYVHTTENSVVVEEAPTTSVSNGVITITIGGSSVSNKKRVYEVLLEAY